MASPENIDLEELLQPISEEAPTGPDVRDNPSPTSNYQIIKNERNQARAVERQSVHDGEANAATEHWRKIASLAPSIIGSESKDLEVACWYAESMIRRSGFGGLRDAFKLVRGLLEQHWENLHPMPDEYGIETRVSCLSGLNGEGAEGVLIAPIRKVSITEGDYPGPFSLWQYQQALDVQKTADDEVRMSRQEKLGYSTDDIDKAVEDSADQFFIDQKDDLLECIEEYKKVGTILDEHCGLEESPPIRNILEVLEECLGAINHIGKYKFPSADDSDTEEGEGEDAEAGETADTNSGNGAKKINKGPIASREEAFKQIAEIAAFFKKTEPHSPVSYVLQKAVKWGNMPLHELMSELITDSSSRERFSELTGVENED